MSLLYYQFLIVKKMKEETSFHKHLHKRLCMLFLHTVFSTPNFLRGEIVKHLEVPFNCVELGKAVEKENEISIPLSITFEDNKQEFLLVFVKRIYAAKEIEVPKVVKNDKKWWQFNEPDTKVIVEKKTINKNQIHWLLNAIE